MKNFYLLIALLLFSIAGIAQGYSVRVHGEIRDGGCGDNSGVREIRIDYTDGTSDMIWAGTRLANADFDESMNSDPNKQIKQIYIWSRRKVNTGLFGSCESGGRDTYDEEPVNNKGCFFKRNDDAFDGVTNGWYEIDIKPIITITPDADDDSGIGYDSDKYKISATPGFDPEAYSWQYQLTHSNRSTNNSDWENLEFDSSTPHTVKFRPDYYFEKDKWPAFELYDNWKLNVRSTQCGIVNTVTDTRVIKYSAPRFIAHSPNIPKVKCFGGSDASVRFTVNREFRLGEKLAVKILNLDDDKGGESSVGQSNDITLDINNSFVVDSLPASSGINGFRAVFISGGEQFTGDPDHIRDFRVESPEYVTFNVTDSTKVKCHGGKDGTISLSAAGGKEDGNYQYARYQGAIKTSILDSEWKPFSNTNTHLETDLAQGTYHFAVRDANACLAEDWSMNTTTGIYDNGGLVTETIVIEEPSAELSVQLVPVSKIRDSDSDDASAFGFNDGRIIANITGGTGPYTLQWSKNGAPEEYVSDSTITGSNEAKNYTHQALLTGIGKGIYTLSVTDANHKSAGLEQEAGCAASASIPIDEPELLQLTLEETNPISCNNNNGDEFTDDFSDGQLTAYASGGVPFVIKGATTHPYKYIWKKEVAPNSFAILENEKDSVLSGVSDGRYAVNIIDANDITIGTAVNNVVTPIDITRYIKEPEAIAITFETGNIACYGGSEGWAKATVSGGTGEFQLQWSNGETTDTIAGLTAGKYALFVTDEKGCKGKAEVRILEPEALESAVQNQKNPTCNDGTDGVILLSVNGGVAPYTYQWSTENGSALAPTLAQNNTIENLVAGTYSVTVTDKNNCTLTQEYILENPSPNLIELGDNRLLCGGQPMIIDATFSDEGTSYVWTSDNGFTSTSPIIEVTEAGTYTVALTTELGCSGGDSITITTSEAEIDAHFVVSSQAFAGEEVALINISSPLGDAVEWYFPPEAEVVVKTDEDVVLVFEKPGAYDIILRSNQGECYLDFMKSIIVEEAEDIADIGDAINPFITEFKIYPNPSDGNFKVDIELTEASDISLKMFSMATQGLLNQRKEAPATEFSLDYGVALSSGSYILLLETAKASEIRKVLIK